MPDLLPLFEHIHDYIRDVLEGMYKRYSVTQIHGEARSQFQPPLHALGEQVLQPYVLTNTDFTYRVEMENAMGTESLSVRFSVQQPGGKIIVELEDAHTIGKRA